VEGKERPNDDQGEAVASILLSSVDSSDPKAAYKVDGLSGATLTSRVSLNLSILV